MEKIVLAVLLAASFLFCVFGGSNANDKRTDIRGKVTKVHRASAEAEERMLGTVMVEAADKNAKVDKANLIITNKTRILKVEDDKRVPATFEELNIGQLVEAQFVEGPTIMIYPLQVAAAEIVILNTHE